jgi:maltooligosyltrehalose trehalohydrolase
MGTPRSQDREAERRLPVGAEPGGGGTHFRVWAPDRGAVEVEVSRGSAARRAALDPEVDGWFGGFVPGAAAGDRYRFHLDGEADGVPDPASRFQPEGPHGPSEIVDPTTYVWKDADWRGLTLRGRVISEIHIGTFTEAGTWRAAAERLPLLADAGIDVLEVMPVAEFPGRFGWGYDGVDLFAPTRLYGNPDDMRAFVDAAHALGMGVVLDVVYNHLGPDGNYLGRFAASYFSRKHRTDWGPAINFGEAGSAAVRAFFLANATYWIREFHVDGFRFDATQDIHDDSDEHILGALSRQAREAAGARPILLIGENEPQKAQLLQPIEEGGRGLDALWNDDFHHTAIVALTGTREAYYTDYFGGAQEFVSVAKHGFLYQGQRYSWQDQRRGTPLRGVARRRLVNFIENHDQLANSGRGERLRLHTASGAYRAVMAFLLLGPATPMLFQGQEYGATTSFLYFADHEPELARRVRDGRAASLSQFRNLGLDVMQARLPDPAAEATFLRSRLDWEERDRNIEMRALTRDLIALRRTDAVFARQGDDGIDGAVLSPDAFVLRWFEPDGDDRLLVVNLGRALHFSPAPEPLLAPPAGARWRTMWSSEDPQYGGGGTPTLDSDLEGWRLPAQCAAALAPQPYLRDHA